jgi:cytochrome c peroxidase
MKKYQIFFLIASDWIFIGGCGTKQVTVDDASLKMYAPLPEMVPAKAAGPGQPRIELGRMLFYDKRLSRNQEISCNSCHDLQKYGVDAGPVSEGFKKQHGERNAPTVFNAAAHFVQFWDGRAADVEAQAKGPVLNPVEMAMTSEQAVVAVLESMPEYVAAFQKAFPDDQSPVSFENMATAIGTFERGLLTPARWDRFLKGDQAALTEAEKAGFHTFSSAGCGTCHAGALLGANLYQKLGIMRPYPDTTDPGRFQATKVESDRMTFKVPSLRNVARTQPYFHNGKVDTLEQAVSQMGEYQLGKQLSQEEVTSIVTFLKALTGDVPAQYIQMPELPKSTAKTPKAETGD